MMAITTGDDGNDDGPNLYELIVRVVPEFERAAEWMDDDYKEALPWGVAAAFFDFAVDAWREGHAELLRRIFEFVEATCAGANSTFENAICLDFVQVIKGTDAMKDFVPLLGPSARECYEAQIHYLRGRGYDVT